MSSNQLKRILKVTYKTAWYLTYRIRAAMLEVAPEKLGGTVEIDETYVGGKARRWRPKSDKAVVVGIRQRNGDLRLIRAENAKSASAREIIKANIGSHVEVIMTDESAIYPRALGQYAKEPTQDCEAYTGMRPSRRAHEYRGIGVLSSQTRYCWNVA